MVFSVCIFCSISVCRLNAAKCAKYFCFKVQHYFFSVIRRSVYSGYSGYRTRVSESVSQSENLRTELTDVKISIEYFTDVTQAIGDTFF